MALTNAQIKALLKVADKPKQRGKKPKNYIDVSVRDYQTWFKLAHKLMDDETMEPVRCSNPNCPDTRHRQMCAEVNGVVICRRCFLDGYQTPIEGQLDLDDVA